MHDYSNTASGATHVLGGPLPSPRTDAPAPINRAIERISMTSERIDYMTNRLRDHGNRLHGPAPEPALETQGQREPHSALDALERVLDLLENSINALGHQVERNTNIA